MQGYREYRDCVCEGDKETKVSGLNRTDYDLTSAED